MEKIIGQITVLAQSLRKNFFSTMLAFLLIIGVIFAWNLSKQVDLLMPNTPAEAAQVFEKTIKTNKLIANKLKLHRGAIQADTIVIKRFHNGTKDLTGLPFEYVTTDFIDSGLDMRQIEPGLERRPMAAMAFTVSDIWADLRNPVCLAQPVRNIKDDLFRNQLLDSGLGFHVICPINNILGYPIGYLGVGYTSPETTFTDLQVIELQQLANVIAGDMQRE